MFGLFKGKDKGQTTTTATEVAMAQSLQDAVDEIGKNRPWRRWVRGGRHGPFVASPAMAQALAQQKAHFAAHLAQAQMNQQNLGVGMGTGLLAAATTTANSSAVCPSSPGSLIQVPHGAPLTQYPGGFGGHSSQPPVGGSIKTMAKSIDEDIEKQISSLVVTGEFKNGDAVAAQGAVNMIDKARIARTVVRILREVPDEVFETAGVNPKHHRENFTKVIDQIMRGL